MPHAARRRPLDAALLAAHRGGQAMCLDVAAFGAARLLSEPRRSAYEPASASAEPAAGVVAVVDVIGPLAQRETFEACAYVYGYDALIRDVSAAIADPDVSAVVLRIDSPGGDVPGLAEAARRLEGMAGQKPILSWVDEMAASAAYYLATATDGIYAPPSGYAGSIGAVLVHSEQSEALKAEGVRVEIFRDPDGKYQGNALEPLSDVARERYARLVGEASAAFRAYVSGRRGVSDDALRALNADMLSAADARVAGLIDGIATFEEVLSLAAARARAAAPATVYRSARGDSMKIPASLAARLGFAPDASDAAHETKIIEWLGVAAAVAEHAKTSDPHAAEGAMIAAVLDAERASDLAAKVSELEAAEAARKADVERAERVTLVEGMVRSGQLAPAKAWAKDASTGLPAREHGIAPEWRDMPISGLRAMASALCPMPGISGSAKADPAKDSPVAEDMVLVVGLSDEQIVRCQAKGRDPMAFSQMHQALFGRRAAD